MQAKSVLVAAVAVWTWCWANTGWADVPAPPVNQSLGMVDRLFGELTEAECRGCHDSSVPDRHHLLYGQPIPPVSLVPYPDANGDGTRDSLYGCLNCHNSSFTPVRDCTVCHTSNAHHKTQAALNNDCVSCHGDIVDNMNDGHYIPTYAPSDVTPSTSGGDGLPLNSRRKGAGACNYCHDDDGLASPTIRNNSDLHHATSYAVDGSLDCLLCHDMLNPLSIRVCERCHGPDSLHSIQADSLKPENLGTIVVGGEDAGYGHVGRDVGPGDSDCWGCHGFATSSAPRSGPMIPTVYSSDVASIRAGSNTTVMLTGACFTNIAGTTSYESHVAMTAADGSSVTLVPDLILDEGRMVVTIPGTAAPGNYDLRAVKESFASNPTVVSIVPKVTITNVRLNRPVVIVGSGFGGYAKGSGTAVTATFAGLRRGRARTVEAAIVSWSNTRIVARFPETPQTPQTLSVRSVFGNTSYKIGSK
jgi:hypothetical protein